MARGEIQSAHTLVRRHADDQARDAGAGFRFPAIGFHWLCGVLEAHAGQHEAALALFAREEATATPRRLYGPEYAAAAHVGRGHALLALGHLAAARDAFRQARAIIDDHPRAWVGEMIALSRLDAHAEARAARDAVAAARRQLDRTDRRHEAALVAASDLAWHGEVSQALCELETVLTDPTPSFLGWSIPVEPGLAPLAGHPRFLSLCAGLARRAGAR